MEDIINLIVNNGIGIVCVGYMIYDRLTATKEMNKVLLKMTETLNAVNTRLTIIEDKLEK